VGKLVEIFDHVRLVVVTKPVGYDDKQMQDTSIVVAQLDEVYAGSVADLLQPNGHLICLWNFDYQRARPDLLSTNKTYLMTELQGVKAKTKNEYAD